MDELMNVTANENAEDKTPIEILLKVDDDEMVSAKNLYEFLEYNPANYARWCEDNLINNESLEENLDFWIFHHNDEKQTDGKLDGRGRPSNDYKITLDVAKDIAMGARSEKGKLARRYFLKCEEGLRVSVKTFKQIQEKIDSYQNMILELDGRLTCIESGISVSGGRISDWVRETSDDVKELADAYGCSPKEMYSRIIERMEQTYGIFFQKYYDEYSARHPKERPVWRLVVVEFYDLQEEFENSYIALGREIGLYNNQIDDFLDF